MPENTLFLSAPVNALLQGIYKQNTPVSELAEHGDFGLGTFNDLDGEMMMLDGAVYQIRADGKVYAVEPETLTPFACVTRFTPDTVEEFAEPMDYGRFMGLLKSMIPSDNMLYAIRVDGDFSHVRTRSVPKQDSYRPLVEVAKEQPEFTFTDIGGALAGFYTPDFLQSLNVPGFHLHFLTQDRSSGGHLLECRPNSVTVSMRQITRLTLGLPMTLDFMTADLVTHSREDIEKAEK